MTVESALKVQPTNPCWDKVQLSHVSHYKQPTAFVQLFSLLCLIKHQQHGNTQGQIPSCCSICSKQSLSIFTLRIKIHW